MRKATGARSILRRDALCLQHRARDGVDHVPPPKWSDDTLEDQPPAGQRFELVRPPNDSAGAVRSEGPLPELVTKVV